MTIYQVIHKQTWMLQEVRNVYYYETQVGNPSTAEWVDIADEIRADYDAELKTTFVSDWSFWGIDYRIVDTVGLPAFEALPTSGELAGTSVEDTIPTQVCMLVSVKSATTRPNRARTYLGGWNETVIDDSLFPSTPRGKGETFVDLQSVLNAGGTNDLQRVAAQWNSTHSQVIATNNIAGSASKASEVPATQRRRRIGVGI